MPDHPTRPEDDDLRAEIQAIAAGLDRAALRIDLSDPALLSLVDLAVAPYEHTLTPDGLERAREAALFALVSAPDLDAVLAKERARLERQGSGVRPTRSAGQLQATARRKSRP
jgi:hypothetical protein